MSGHSEGNNERWIISYADFITLLMVLFVVLYSMGQTDINRYKQLAQGLRAAFAGIPLEIIDPQIDESGGTSDNQTSTPITIPGIPQTPLDSAEVANELSDMLSAANLSSEISVQNNIEGVLISLSEKLVYNQGTAQLQPEAYPVLDTIIKMIKPLNNEIRITGYTDDSAPTDTKYENNWELSVARAIVISDYFQKGGIAPERITVAGRGQYNPIFPNDSAAHRALNSRAEIIVIYSVTTDSISPNLATQGD
jgi:chemotaxis protein MotB